MAFSTSSYHNNNIPGNIDLAKFNIRESVTSPTYALGTRVNLSDGRSFRYAQFGAATTRARLVSMDVSAMTPSAAAATTLGIIAPVSSNTTSDGTSGQRFVQFTLSGMSVNELAGGYFHTADSTGEGYTYRIKGNTATSTPATGDVRIELYDKLEEEVASTTSVFLMGSLYTDLKEADTSGTDSLIAGITTANHATTGKFGWVQTWGPGAVEVGTESGDITAGMVLTAGTGSAGVVMNMGGAPTTASTTFALEPIVGVAMNSCLSTSHILADIKITP